MTQRASIGTLIARGNDFDAAEPRQIRHAIAVNVAHARMLRSRARCPGPCSGNLIGIILPVQPGFILRQDDRIARGIGARAKASSWTTYSNRVSRDRTTSDGLTLAASHCNHSRHSLPHWPSPAGPHPGKQRGMNVVGMILARVLGLVVLHHHPVSRAGGSAPRSRAPDPAGHRYSARRCCRRCQSRPATAFAGSHSPARQSRYRTAIGRAQEIQPDLRLAGQIGRGDLETGSATGQRHRFTRPSRCCRPCRHRPPWRRLRGQANRRRCARHRLR